MALSFGSTPIHLSKGYSGFHGAQSVSEEQIIGRRIFGGKKSSFYPILLIGPQAMAVSRADPPFVVYAGRLSREKRGLSMIDPNVSTAEEYPFKIIGDGPLSTLSRSTGGTAPIEFLGHRSHEETQRWIAQASAVVIPSECYENLPQVALEAWAAGTPLIVSQIGGLVELVEKHGAALGFQAGQADDLARLVRRCMEDSGLRSRLQEAGRKALESRFHPDTIYAGLMDVYQQAMTSKSIVKAPSSRI